MGKNVQVKFTVDKGSNSKEKPKDKWFDGIVAAYDGVTGKYGIYFPCDQQTVYMLPNDADLRFRN